MEKCLGPSWNLPVNRESVVLFKGSVQQTTSGRRIGVAPCAMMYDHLREHSMPMELLGAGIDGAYVRGGGTLYILRLCPFPIVSQIDLLSDLQVHISSSIRHLSGVFRHPKLTFQKQNYRFLTSPTLMTSLFQPMSPHPPNAQDNTEECSVSPQDLESVTSFIITSRNFPRELLFHHPHSCLPTPSPSSLFGLLQHFLPGSLASQLALPNLPEGHF